MSQPTSLSRTALSTIGADTIVSSLLNVQTTGAGFVDLTAEVAKFVSEAGAREGAVSLFIRHTSASLTVQENADPLVLEDLMTALDRLAPEDAGWRHDTEGPDDMPAHVKTVLTASSLHIPVLKGELALGTWQAIYLIEHRARPHRREVVLQFAGVTRWNAKPAAERSAAGFSCEGPRPIVRPFEDSRRNRWCAGLNGPRI